jgi:hypothetical protein
MKAIAVGAAGAVQVLILERGVTSISADEAQRIAANIAKLLELLKSK